MTPKASRLPTPPGETPAATTPEKINGRKRFIVTDTLGLLLVVTVLAASVQERDDAKSILLDTYLRTGAVHLRRRRVRLTPARVGHPKVLPLTEADIDENDVKT